MSWWAYLHRNGEIVVDGWDQYKLSQASNSPYVEKFLRQPFEAESYEDAKRIAKELIKTLD